MQCFWFLAGAAPLSRLCCRGRESRFGALGVLRTYLWLTTAAPSIPALRSLEDSSTRLENSDILRIKPIED
jgi:hypothetical protein